MIRIEKNTTYFVANILCENILDFSKYRHIQYDSSSVRSVTTCEFFYGFPKKKISTAKTKSCSYIPHGSSLQYKTTFQLQKLGRSGKAFSYIPGGNKRFNDFMVCWRSTSHYNEDHSVDQWHCLLFQFHCLTLSSQSFHFLFCHVN